MTGQISLADALTLSLLAVGERQIPYRALHDMAYIIKSPVDAVVAVDALLTLKDLVDAYYEKEHDYDFAPPQEHGYTEAGDGDPVWLLDDPTEGDL